MIKTFILLAVLLPSVAYGALAIDSTNSNQGNDPLSVSRTIAVGATLDVLLCAADSTTNKVTSVARSTDTYSLLREDVNGVAGVNSSIWYVVNPVSGTANAVATVAAVTEGLGCWGISFTGGDTTNPFRSSTGAQDDSDDQAESNDATSVLTGDIIIDIIGVHVATTTALTAGANQTSVPADCVEDSGVGHGYCGSYQAGSDGATMSWSWATTNAESAHTIAVVQPAASTRRAQAPIIF